MLFGREQQHQQAPSSSSSHFDSLASLRNHHHHQQQHSQQQQQQESQQEQEQATTNSMGDDGYDHTGQGVESFFSYENLNVKVLNEHTTSLGGGGNGSGSGRHHQQSGWSFGFGGGRNGGSGGNNGASAISMAPFHDDTDCFAASNTSGEGNSFGLDLSCLRPSSEYNNNNNNINDTNSQIGSTAFLEDRGRFFNNRHAKRLKTDRQQANNPSEATDKLLSDELKRLTIHEREKVTEDIHGISDVIEETAEFVQQSIEQFDSEIIKLRKRHARITSSTFAVAYEKALFLNPRLVQQDTNFKLLFLRGDAFNAEKAASRMMLFFTTKLELFGLDKLTKQPITLDDLSDEDKECLYTGGIQPLPMKDRSGRRVIMVFPKHTKMGMSPPDFRAMFYSLMAAVEDDADVQRRGSVYVFNFLGGHTSNLQPPTPQNLRMPKQFHTCLPRRIAAMHAIYDDAALGPFLIVLALILPKLQAIRFRSHFGSHLEGTYALRSFGIPADYMPVDDITGMELDNDWFHNVYLEERKVYENQLDETRRQSDWIVPTSNDCLLGRGRPFQEHVGNKKLAALIDEQRPRYAEAGQTYGRKNVICEEIVSVVHKSGGRFLKQRSNDPLDGWEVVPDEIARDKVSHGFRTAKKTNKSTTRQKSD